MLSTVSVSSTGTQAVVFITGCSSGGIGFELCEKFAPRGCIVYATARRLESMKGLKNPNIRKLVLDVTNGTSIERTVETILTETGKIDIVVNNAGASTIGPTAKATIGQVRNAFELNIFGALRVSQAVIPSMVQRKQGLIVNIGSIVAHVQVNLSSRKTAPWNNLYCAAKAALHSITDGLAMECKPFGIKVMLVAPGGIQSNIAKNQAMTMSLSPTTMYKLYEHKTLQRLNKSQAPGHMDTDEFARRVAAQALKAHPPSYMTLGLHSIKFYILQWLPRHWVLAIMYKTLID